MIQWTVLQQSVILHKSTIIIISDTLHLDTKYMMQTNIHIIDYNDKIKLAKITDDKTANNTNSGVKHIVDVIEDNNITVKLGKPTNVKIANNTDSGLKQNKQNKGNNQTYSDSNSA